MQKFLDGLKWEGINWQSKFLRNLLFKYVLLFAVPQLIFWSPYILQILPLNLDLGWQLNGNTWLPSFILGVIYCLMCLMAIFWSLKRIDYKMGRKLCDVYSDQVTFENIKIPIGGGYYLPGDLVKSPSTPKKKSPVIIMCHGLNSERQNYYSFGIPLSFIGFTVLFYDSRGHGEAKFGNKWDMAYIIKDFNKIVDFIERRAKEVGDLNSKEIIAWGISQGGGIVLNEAYLDQRIKFVIALAAWADLQMTATRKLKFGIFSREKLMKAGYELIGINLEPTDLQNRLVSPILNSFNKKKGFFDHPVYWDIDNNYRVMLAHCKDDEIINYENFEINRRFLGLKPANYIIFKNGNHSFAGMETALMGKMLLWLWQRGY
ncbi:MAG: alpha/beta fold hydrolase [Candidatus Lokiarchaeota archaeon]|nr:alpha/beta fold hydrolase [Candidatus Lokiarchaeota archaeon]